MDDAASAAQAEMVRPWAAVSLGCVWQHNINVAALTWVGRAQAAAKFQVPFRIGEGNSIACGGYYNISDTMVRA